MEDTHSYTISELADRAAVTPRTIRYYTAEGLLPAPDTRSKYALYGEEHLLRLLLITRLKDAYLPLSEIRNRLEGLTKADLQALLATEAAPAAAEPQISASAYIAKVMQSYPGAARAIAEQSSRYQQAPIAPGALPGAPPAPLPSPVAPAVGYIEVLPSQPDTGEEQQWRRITLSSDVELHIREPQSERRRERVQQIIEHARQLLHEKEYHS